MDAGQAEPVPTFCTFEDCGKQAYKQGLCHGHRKQWLRRKRLCALRTRGDSRLQVLRESIFDLMEVDPGNAEDWTKCWNRIRVAARRWVLAEKPKARKSYRSPSCEPSPPLA